MKQFLKNNKKKIILTLAILVIIIASVLITYKFTSNKMSEVEKLKIKDISSKIDNYLEYLEIQDDQTSAYIIYALKYSSYENDKSELTFKEISTFISDTFNIEISASKIEEYGITPYMVENNITSDYSKQTYTLNNSNASYSDIANTKISKYFIKDIKKKDSNTYIITYSKYLISDPYKVLEYYENNNNQIESKINQTESEEEKENLRKEIIDTTEISNYLTGKDNVNSIKEYIKEDNVTSFGEYQKDVSVDIILKDNKLLIDNIN